MNLVDSCGWLEYFADSSKADSYASALEDPEELIVPSICIYEVFKVIFRQMDEDAALHAAAAMQEGEVIDIDAAISLSAAKISSTMNLPMADSMILAIAKQHNAVIWTQDSDFKDIEGVTYIGD